MKLCDRQDCMPVCDFCKWFTEIQDQFRAGTSGLGECSLMLEPTDIGSWCNRFHCFENKQDVQIPNG